MTWLWGLVTHNLSRFLGVVLVGVVLVVGPYLLYRYGYNRGYKEGYAKAAEKPTYAHVDTVINNQSAYNKEFGLSFKIGKADFRLLQFAW